MERRDFIKFLGGASLFMGVTPSVFSSFTKKSCDEEKCRAAWKGLGGKDKGPFRYIHPQEGMPKVLLYGDSISIGYTEAVRTELDGKANVFRLFTNGESSNVFIQRMELMKTSMFQPFLNEGWDFKWDVIHFNVGLHDLKYLNNNHLDKENGKQVTSIRRYKANLKEIVRYLKSEFPQARLIFATTTPVPENAEGRFEGDSIKYNKAALDVLARFPEIVINDLYSLTKPNHEEWMIKPGNVHYNNTGRAMQGKEVARIIAKNL